LFDRVAVFAEYYRRIFFADKYSEIADRFRMTLAGFFEENASSW
jgi:hypothetical protein